MCFKFFLNFPFYRSKKSQLILHEHVDDLSEILDLMKEREHGESLLPFCEEIAMGVSCLSFKKISKTTACRKMAV